MCLSILKFCIAHIAFSSLGVVLHNLVPATNVIARAGRTLSSTIVCMYLCESSIYDFEFVYCVSCVFKY